ncbi:hypothetical protein DICPUDRAFT_92017 [Dictyostelium purpureum]|uniref:SH3 domain-containing protein n=1 Tax=Dictyostelium purpureum TaxID=5786 RepID=F0ZKM3_DICPU|nr:uncharacterized protein DICPUDRAFT_92017 [Dictyostelium purpureum]EGC35502.1 hypothetical protein DICPUDRAFT_92017 [Dictyostelium purpureum]|eukprot:XP_003287981.1 hypothetical protein DICPUDRAFT_92017 [Dictyostelium purpureum]
MSVQQKTFSEDLWDKFESVTKKVDNGKLFTQTLSKFLAKQHQIESSYAKSMIKLCKDKSYAPDMEMGTLRDGFQSYREQLELIGALHEEFSNRLEKLVTGQIDVYLEESRKQRKALIANGEKCTKDLKTAESNETKAKQNYEKLKRKQEESHEDLSKQPPGAKEQKARKNLESATKAADKADNEYRESVRQLQQNQNRFYHEEMPRILDDLQRFEVERIDKTKDWLLEICTQAEVIPPEVIDKNQKIRRGIENIDREKDLHDYIVATWSGAQRPQEAQYEPYQSSVLSPSFNISSPAGARKSGDSSLGSSTGFSNSSSNGNLAATANGYQNIDQQHPPTPHITNPPAIIHSSANTTPNAMTTPPQPVPIYQQPPSQPAPPIVSLSKNVNSNSINNHNGNNNENEDSVRALYDYNATEENEITFKANDLIKVVLKDESGWWQGSVVGDPTGRVGSFPSNFIKSDAPNQKKVDVTGSKCKVLYDYHPDCEGELDIQEGEILTIEYEDEGWYFGSNSKGVAGKYPSNYVQCLDG